jgi:Tol biopolymer transport system component
MTEPRKLRVFLCHSSQDKPTVRELYQRLNAEAWIDPWLDEEKLLPGQDWDLEIEKAVEAADAVVVCLSNNSISKEGYIQRELRFVLDIALEKPEGTIYIIPLRLENCLPPRRLRSWQYVDYFPVTQKNTAYKRILKSLSSRFLVLGIFEKKPHDDSKEIVELHKTDGEYSPENQTTYKDARKTSSSRDGNLPEVNPLHKKKHLGWILKPLKLIASVLLILGVVVLFSLGFQFFIPQDDSIPTNSENLVLATSTFNDLVGPVAVSTTVPKSFKLLFSNHDDGDIYTFDFEDNKLEKIIELDLDKYISDISISPDQTKIALSDGDIYIMDIDGSNLIRLTDHPAGDFSPIWSPDGTMIVFRSERDRLGHYKSYVINLNASNSIMQIDTPSSWGQFNEWGEWAPWRTLYHNSYAGISFFDVLANQIEIIEQDCMSSRLMNARTFLGESVFGVRQDNGIYQINILNSNGENITSFSSEVSECTSLALSHDGTKVALVNLLSEKEMYGGNKYYEEFSVSIYDRMTRELISDFKVTDAGFFDEFQSVSWLPNNEDIVLSTRRFVSIDLGYDFVYIYDFEGRKKKVVNFSEQFDDGGSYGFSFLPSPDGEKMAIANINLDSVYVLYVEDYRIERIADFDSTDFDWLEK